MAIREELYNKLIRNDMIDRAKQYLKDAASRHAPISLPDELLFTGVKQDINVCLHTELSNGFYHKHDFFEIIYVYKGSVTDDVDGEKVTLNKTDALIHNPNARHAITRFSDNEDILVNILISRNVFKKSLYNLLFNNENIDCFFNSYLNRDYDKANYMLFRNADGAEKIVDILTEEFYKEEGRSQIVLESTLMLLLGALLRGYEQRENDGLAHDIVEYLSANLESATLEGAAARFGYHPKYFSALIKRKTNLSFKELLTELRLKKAAQLLKLSDLPIDEIAALTGYGNKSTLYALFKKFYGVTPVAFRNS